MSNVHASLVTLKWQKLAMNKWLHCAIQASKATTNTSIIQPTYNNTVVY